jgi:hypothetical protein
MGMLLESSSPLNANFFKAASTAGQRVFLERILRFF